MPSYDNTGKISYAYDADTDTWFAMLGKASTAANYDWTGSHSFATNVVAKFKFNSFLNPAARTSAIPSPAVGLISFIQEDASANTVNKFQFWNGTIWEDVAGIAYSASSPDSPQEGNLWIDSDTDKMFFWNGTSWIAISSVSYDTASPSNPQTGDVWIDSDTSEIYVYNGSTWVSTIASQLVDKVIGDGITHIVALTQAEYDALATKSATTLYVVTT